MENDKFDFEGFRKDAVAKLQAGDCLLGEGGAFTPLLKAFLEEALNGELEAHIAEQYEKNRKNGKGKKTGRCCMKIPGKACADIHFNYAVFG